MSNYFIHLYSPRKVLNLYSAYRVQLIPGFIGWCKHGEGAFAFNFLSQP